MDEYRVMYIGAHPDDADFEAGGLMAKLVDRGACVRAVSVCSGDKGHQTLAPEELAKRRYGETQAAAKALGIERYTVIGYHDCELEPTLAARREITGLIRGFSPHVVITHRLCDYHADHRATGQLVQDAAYIVGVPHWCPEWPIPSVKPLYLFSRDKFTYPRELRPDLLVDVTPVRARIVAAMRCHASQVFEWLPWENGWTDVPDRADDAAVADYIVRHWFERKRVDAARFGAVWLERHPGTDVPEFLEAFEVSEYGRAPDANDLEWLK